MLIKSSLPSSIEATLFYVSVHEKQDVLCDWMPHAETWQMFSKCDDHSRGGCEEALLITEKKKADNSCLLNLPRSCSQLSTVSTMSESYAHTFVYSRRKLRGNSVAPSLAQASAKAKRSGDYLSVVSSDAPSLAANDHHGVSQVEPETEVVEAPLMPSIVCNRETHASKSKFSNECLVVQERVSDEALKKCLHKTIDVESINDSCSSSKSNVELALASMKTEVDETGECSSSSIVAVEVVGEDLSEKDLCISILRNQGVLEGARSTRNSSEEDTGISSSSSCSRSCKICGLSETSLNMLICDNCEEAFHTSCCNPRIKKIPIDEWFCHSCLKKKHKILKETTVIKSTNITSRMGKSRNSSSKAEVNPIALMLRDSEPHTTGVRIGKGFQAEVPDWLGPIDNDVNTVGEPLEADPSECINLHELNSNKPSKLSSIGNWLQCKEVLEGVGEGFNGTICGKWRRAPLFEVQTDDWECFCSVLWDPFHADCAVPQELETDQILKQLKYIEMLRPRLTAKRQKLDRTKSGGSQETRKDATNT